MTHAAREAACAPHNNAIHVQQLSHVTIAVVHHTEQHETRPIKLQGWHLTDSGSLHIPGAPRSEKEVAGVGKRNKSKLQTQLMAVSSPARQKLHPRDTVEPDESTAERPRKAGEKRLACRSRCSGARVVVLRTLPHGGNSDPEPWCQPRTTSCGTASQTEEAEASGEDSLGRGGDRPLQGRQQIPKRAVRRPQGLAAFPPVGGVAKAGVGARPRTSRRAKMARHSECKTPWRGEGETSRTRSQTPEGGYHGA